MDRQAGWQGVGSQMDRQAGWQGAGSQMDRQAGRELVHRWTGRR